MSNTWPKIPNTEEVLICVGPPAKPSEVKYADFTPLVMLEAFQIDQAVDKVVIKLSSVRFSVTSLLEFFGYPNHTPYILPASQSPRGVLLRIGAYQLYAQNCALKHYVISADTTRVHLLESVTLEAPTIVALDLPDPAP